ncbi:MAG: hypothetical protein ACXVEF_10950 [Polyangiales bacterium]
MRKLALLLVALPSCFPMEGPRTYPSWARAQTVPTSVGCLRVDGWVVQSGKQGLGLTLEVSTPSDVCPFSMRVAELDVGGERVQAKSLPASATLHHGQTIWVYLPFFFDGDRAWNEDRRAASLRLAFDSGETRWELTNTMPDRNLCEERTP